MDNRNFATGSVRFVGSEIRTILLSKMLLTEGKNICVISGESIAIEAAIQDGEGTVIAVEYSKSDRSTLEQNVNQFGLNNVVIVDHVDEDNFKGLPVPDVTMLVASASMEQEMKFLLELNPKMEFVIYTLDFVVAASMPKLFKEFGLGDPEIIQMTISKLTSKNTYRTDLPPASEARGKSAQGVALAGEGFPRQSTFYKIIVAFFLLFLYNRRAVMRMGSVRCSGVNPVRSERKQQ